MNIQHIEDELYQATEVDTGCTDYTVDFYATRYDGGRWSIDLDCVFQGDNDIINTLDNDQLDDIEILLQDQLEQDYQSAYADYLDTTYGDR